MTRRIAGLSVLVNGTEVANVTRNSGGPRFQWWLNRTTYRPEPMSPTGQAKSLHTSFLPTLPKLRAMLATLFPGCTVRYHFVPVANRAAA